MMVSKKLLGLGLLFLVVFLTGCGGEIVTDLYIQDVYEVLAGVEEPIFTDAVIAIVVLDEESNAELIESLALNLRDAANPRTWVDDEEDITYLMMDVKVPILDYEHIEDLWTFGDVLGIVVMETDGGSIALGVGINREKFVELVSFVNDDSWEVLSIRDFNVFVNLVNDTKNPISVVLQSVYADGEPLPYEEVYDFPRASSSELRLSDVARDLAYNEGLMFFGIIEK